MTMGLDLKAAAKEREVMMDIQEQRLLLLECVEYLARKLATSHLQFATTTTRRKYADKYWIDYVPTKYKFLFANE